MAECHPDQNKNDDRTEATASKFARPIRCDEASEKIVHAYAFDVLVNKTLCLFQILSTRLFNPLYKSGVDLHRVFIS